MIKPLVDALRGAEGYAGMAVYSGENMLFFEGIEPGHADRAMGLFKDARARFPASRMSVVIRGYTISVFSAGDLVVTVRYAGRLRLPPVLVEEEAEYAAGQPPSGLISRDDARKEAEAMLRALMSGADF